MSIALRAIVTLPTSTSTGSWPNTKNVSIQVFGPILRVDVLVGSVTMALKAIDIITSQSEEIGRAHV